MKSVKTNKARRQPTARARLRRQAVKDAGLTLKQIGKRICRKEGTIRLYQRQGCTTIECARKMSSIVKCPLDYYLWK